MTYSLMYKDTESSKSIFDSVVTKEVSQPECFSMHEGFKYRYMNVYNEQQEQIASIAMGFITDTECLIHMEFNKWSPKVLSATKTAVFSVGIPALKKLGTTKLIAIK